MLNRVQLIAVFIFISILSGCSDDKHADNTMNNQQGEEHNSPISSQMRALEQAKGIEQLTQDHFSQQQQEIDRQSD